MSVDLPVSTVTKMGKPNALAFPRHPGEPYKEWSARWRAFKKQERERLKLVDNRSQEGLRLFCEEKMELGMIAARLGGDYSWWVRKSLEGNWELLKSNLQASRSLAGGEQRLLVAKRVDAVVLHQIETVVRRAGEVYLNMIEAIAKLPESMDQMTELDGAALKEDEDKGESDRSPVATLDSSGGAIKGRPGPKKSRHVLLGNKLGLLNDATRGIMSMANQARMLGLVSIPEPLPQDDGHKGQQDEQVVSKIKTLNLILLTATRGEVIEKVPEKQVLEIGQ